MFSVALAVCEPSRSHPGRYPAHCPAEFGLSSPGNPPMRATGSDRPVLLPALVYPEALFFAVQYFHLALVVAGSGYGFGGDGCFDFGDVGR
jgi:hypothetical protein